MNELNSKFKVGDNIYKIKGYKFNGRVASVFKTASDKIRVVAEMHSNGMLHIFSEDQLELDTTLDGDQSLQIIERARAILDEAVTDKENGARYTKQHYILSREKISEISYALYLLKK
jgi:hypothetical protein